MKVLLKQSAIIGLAGLVLGLIFPRDLLAQITDPTGSDTGQRGAPRAYKFGARTTALGNATVADPHSLMSVNINPASLSFVRNLNTVQVNMHQNWRNNLMFENFAFPLFANRRHTLAGQAGFHHGGINATNLLGTNPLPQPSISVYQVDLAYAYNLSQVFSIGILSNFSYAKTNNEAQYWTSFATLGLIYSPSQSVSYGASFRGLGRSVVYQFPGGGITALGSQNLREVLELGATMRFPVDTEDPYLSFSMSNEKRFGENGIWYKGGIEVKVMPSLALRTGLLIQSATDVIAPRFGVGIIDDVIELDYAISYHQELYERFHQLSLTLHIDNY